MALDARRRTVTSLRLSAQGLASPADPTPAAVASRMLALQGQDLAGVRWSLALRTPDPSGAAVDAAFADGSIVRSWPFRGTLHVVAAADLRWLLALTGERTIRSAAGRHRQLGIDAQLISRAAALAEDELASAGRMTRERYFERLSADGIDPSGQRGVHLLSILCLRRLLVLGPLEGKGQAFVGFEDWLPGAPERDRDESLRDLVVRYVAGHGPATERDLAWWSSLTLTDIRAGLALAGDAVERLEVEGTTYLVAPGSEPAPAPPLLLPGFDEYLLGYSDRSAALASEHSEAIVPGGNGVFQSTIVVDGEVVGLWRRTLAAKTAKLELRPFEPLSEPTLAALSQAVERYSAFLAKPVTVAV